MFKKILTRIGGAALLAAMSIDTLAVIGRYAGLPLRGSIELIEPMVLVSGSVGLVLATLAANHAKVRLVIERLGEGTRDMLERLWEFSSLLFFLCLLAGSTWIAADLWNGHEVSELIGVPWRVLRLFANFCLLALCAISLRRLIGKRAP
jgi:TRAP-type C4-dicarboxylate transport system permease small subunit